MYDRLRKKRDELLILLHQRQFMIQNEKVLSESNDDLFEMIKTELQEDQFINMNKKDDAAVAKKRD